MSTSTTAKPHKIAIVGGGISGLTTALSLSRKAKIESCNITIYETRSETSDANQGGALNLSGGSSILYHEYGIDLREHASLFSRVFARSSSARTLFKFDVKCMLEGGKGENSLVDENGKSLLVSIMRSDLLNVLLNEVVIKDGIELKRGLEYEVQNVIKDIGILEFSNGLKSEPYDLIIGADGVRSNIRNTISSSTQSKYTGFRILWGVGSSSSTNKFIVPYGDVHQWFGDGLYVMQYAGGTENNRIPLTVISFRDNKPNDENILYSETLTTKEEGIHLLTKSDFPEDVIKGFENCTQFVSTAVYEYDESTSWFSNIYKTVLVGDSAHAMAPYLGQGANQAIQDAHVLGSTMLNNESDDIWNGIKLYESIRKGPTSRLVKSSKFVGLLETQNGKVGMFIRNNLFKFAYNAGILQKTFMSSCIPTSYS